MSPDEKSRRYRQQLFRRWRKANEDGKRAVIAMWKEGERLCRSSRERRAFRRTVPAIVKQWARELSAR